MERFYELLRANRGAAIAAGVITVFGLVSAGLVGLPPAFMVGLLAALALITWGIYRWRTRQLDHRPARAPARTLVSSALVALVTVFLAAQAVPYGRDHANAPITGEPDWATAATRDLMVRACFDCHSNEVEWPWYSNVAPLSWAIWKHVDDGRSKVNYSEWDRPQREADKSVRETRNRSMPPAYYTFGGLHSEGNLSAEELLALLEGLGSTPGLS